jgi:hypothetical protein
MVSHQHLVWHQPCHFDGGMIQTVSHIGEPFLSNVFYSL